jgi:peptidoglycan/LPS O-acetylase OafA/YrhL
MKNIFKVDYYAAVHLFWAVLLLTGGFLLNHSYGDYIAENNLYDFHLARAGEAGVGMAAVYFMMGLFHRKGNPVLQFTAIFGLYLIFELYPIVMKNASVDFWRFGYLGLAGLLIWFVGVPFQKKHQHIKLSATTDC